MNPALLLTLILWQDATGEPAAQTTTPPPVLPTLGVVFFGDAGTGREGQYMVSEAVRNFCQTQRCDLVLLLGDNFGDRGVTSADDPLWQERFSTPYAPLGLPFRPVIGNHDREGSVQAQVEHSQQPTKDIVTGGPSTWDMPALYYHFEAGPVAFFALDTTAFDRKQRRWLRAGLRDCQQPFTVVYGHHPVHSHGQHGGSPSLVRRLQPLLRRNQVDLYLSGHDHDQQVLDSGEPPLWVVMGSGAHTRAAGAGPDTLYAASSPGFGWLSFQPDAGALTVVDWYGQITFFTPLPPAAEGRP